MKSELLLRHRAIIGEGALWDNKTQRLYWIDIDNGEIHRLNPETREDKLIAKYPEKIGTVVLRENGEILAAYQSGLYAVKETTGERELLAAAPYAGDPGLRFNDGKCDPDGRLWVGEMVMDERYGAGKLYNIDKNLQFETMLENVTISNGIIWSPDRRTMYYADSPTKEVVAFDYHQGSGQVENRRTVARTDFGTPDGMTIDSEGYLWVCQWGGWQVGRYDPFSGRKVDWIDVPAAQVTSCAFGGPAMDTLFITTAAVNLKDDEQPEAGSIFVVKPGITGLSSYRFQG